MVHQALRPEFRALIDEHAPVRQLGSGFLFCEGPIWHPVQHYLLFSDMPADTRRRWDRAGVRPVTTASNKGNGMTYDAALDLIVCEHATSSVVRIAPDGRRTVLASHFEGRELNSPNDLCIRRDGSIYFTDPWYGRMPVYGVERPRELGWQGVFRIRPGEAGRDPELLVDRHMFTMPNGICFSPDERRLYVNDTMQANIRVFDVDAAGSLSNARIFASGIRDSLKPGVPDGMKCDAEGHVWVTAPGGVWVYAPDGRQIGAVSVPELVGNLHWGGADWRTLFLCASTALYAVDTKVGPHGELFMQARAGAPPVPAGSRIPAETERRPPAETERRPPAETERRPPAEASKAALALEPARCALIIQDMQNDVVMEGGAFASSGSPAHCREQNAIPNIARLAEQCRALGVPVIHVWFLVEPGAPGLTLNAPLFEGVLDAKAVVRGTWGAEPVPGLEPKGGDHLVPKMRMSAWEGTTLETILKAERRDIVIVTGAWTNMSVEHTARTGADKGYVMIVPEDGCSTMNADWHRASIDYALQNVSAVTKVDHVIAALRDAAGADPAAPTAGEALAWLD